MKLSIILAVLGAGAALAAPAPGLEPTPTYGDKPTEPPPYYPTQSVSHKAWKRHIERDAIPEAGPKANPVAYGPPPPPYPTQSVSHKAWKRHIDHDAPVQHNAFEMLTA